MLRRQALLALLGLMLTACGSSEPPPASFSDIRFTGDPPIRFDAARVEIVSSFQPTFQSPEVEQDFPVPPQRAIENWVHDQLQAANPSSPNRVRVTIRDAAVREVRLPLTPGISGALTTEQSARFDAHAAATVELLDEHGFAVRTASAEASHSRTIEEGASLDERDLVWYEMTRLLVGNLARELDRQIRGSFYPYVE